MSDTRVDKLIENFKLLNDLKNEYIYSDELKRSTMRVAISKLQVKVKKELEFHINYLEKNISGSDELSWYLNTNIMLMIIDRLEAIIHDVESDSYLYEKKQSNNIEIIKSLNSAIALEQLVLRQNTSCKETSNENDSIFI